jgi:DNA polymerase-1
VDDRVTLYDPFKDRTLDAAAVQEKYGVEPCQFIDWLALTGDASDNIPGVCAGWPQGRHGPLAQFGTLSALYERLDEVSSASLREKLAQGRDDAMLPRTLATIDRHVAWIRQTPTPFPFCRGIWPARWTS